MSQSVPESSVWHSNRYLVEGELGRGGMGVVYRAYDRLQRRHVALKRIGLEQDAPASTRSSIHSTVIESSRPPHLSSNSLTTSVSLDELSEDDHQRLALAREFRILASLRHPHIISVLDYGFDQQGRSYLVMELLDDARTLTEANELYPLEQRLILISELMQALRYLHRVGVVHRDLKPENVLVVEIDGTPMIKVVDFGLAVWAQQHHLDAKPAGTVAYMAPEVLMGAVPDEATDLYSLGVLSYEVCTGYHPFAHLPSKAEMITAARYGMINLKELPLNDAAQRVIGALMSPRIASRPPGAGRALERWCAALDLEVPSEPLPVRDSFLRAARFVGRERELAQLSGALDAALMGNGSAWLISGASGVGKSRLLDEVRAAAQVRGMLVVHGQALDAGGQSFAVWRDILREVALYTELSPLEASVLRDLIRELDVLLDRAIDPAPALDRDGNLRRFMRVVEALLDRLQMPALLLLEDLHWATPESITLLRRLAAKSSGRRSVLLGSLRNDRPPAWAEQITADTILLHPFSPEQSRAMCEAIIGQGNARPELLAALSKSSGGNAFFIAELLRSLAETHGSLDKAGEALGTQLTGLNPAVLSRQRLARLPASAREPLELAAVAGRQLDLDLLDLVVPDLQGWLSTCAAASVVEVVQDRWRFSHDKLREQLLEQLPLQRRQQLHDRVAQTLSRAHGEKLPAAVMAYHLAAGQEPHSALPYLLDAAEEALRQGALSRAHALAENALQMARGQPDHQLNKARARLVIIDTGYALSMPESSVEHVHILLTEAGLLGRNTKMALLRQLLSAPRRHALDIDLGQHNAKLWELVLRATNIGFHLHVYLGNSEEALLLLFLSHNLSRALGLEDKAAVARAGIAYALSMTPARRLARPLLEGAAEIIERHRTDYATPSVYEARGLVALNTGRWNDAVRDFHKLETIGRTLGDERQATFGMLQQCLAMQARGDLSAARAKLSQVHQYASTEDDNLLRAQAYNRRGWLSLHAGALTDAYQSFKIALAGETMRLVRLSAQGGWCLTLWLHDEQLDAEQQALSILNDVRARRVSGHAGIFAIPAMTYVLLAIGHNGTTDRRRLSASMALDSLRTYSRQFPVARPSHYMLTGYHAHRQGHTRRARRLLAKSVRVAEELGMKLDHAMATLLHSGLAGESIKTRRAARNARRDLQSLDAMGCMSLIEKLPQ